MAPAGLHSWTDDDIGNVAAWGIRSFAPEELRSSTRPLLDRLAATGCSRVAVHFDVDTADSDEVRLGLGAEPAGLTCGQVRRIVADIDGGPTARRRGNGGPTARGRGNGGPTA